MTTEPPRYHIEEYNDGPVTTYAVFLDTTAPDSDGNDEAEGELINEFDTRAEAEACIQALIIGPT